jgi:hypothetical protein
MTKVRPSRLSAASPEFMRPSRRIPSSITPAPAAARPCVKIRSGTIATGPGPSGNAPKSFWDPVAHVGSVLGGRDSPFWDGLSDSQVTGPNPPAIKGVDAGIMLADA